MLITIAGCGALGCSLGAHLIDAGHEIQAFGRKGPHLDALRREGIRLAPDWTGTERTFPLTAASDDPDELSPCDLVIVLVKTHQSAAVAPVRRALKPEGVCLTLQNGLGNAETLAPIFGEDNLAVGIAAFGATRLAPGVVDASTKGSTVIAGPWARARDMSWVGEALTSGLDAQWVDDPRPAVWNKLCINAMMNPTAALTGLPNGKLVADPHGLELLRALFMEAADAAANAGVTIDREAAFGHAIEILTRDATVRPSMLQDLDAGRKTETDAISGGVLRYAKSDADFPRTRTMHALMKTIDARNGHAG
ncbi:ketopantoate reductase family protein [Desulfocurvus sp. DL9XJH121]